MKEDTIFAIQIIGTVITIFLVGFWLGRITKPTEFIKDIQYMPRELIIINSRYK